MAPKRGNRIVFYLNDEEAEQLEQVIAAAETPRADYLRQVLLSASEGTTKSISGHIRVLEEALQDTRQSKDRLEQLLLQSQTTVADLTRALPAPASNGHRPWWRVW